MYLAKFHLSTAYVLRDRPPPITLLLNHWGTHALIYLSRYLCAVLVTSVFIILCRFSFPALDISFL